MIVSLTYVIYLLKSRILPINWYSPLKRYPLKLIMNTETDNTRIETDLFQFEAPAAYAIESLDGQAELVGPNDEFLVVSCYTMEDNSEGDSLDDFIKNISEAMVSAADEADLQVSRKLRKDISEQELPVWSLLSEATDKSHFFDQYAVLKGGVAVVVTFEGNYQQRSSTAAVEEAVHSVEFK